MLILVRVTVQPDINVDCRLHIPDFVYHANIPPSPPIQYTHTHTLICAKGVSKTLILLTESTSTR